MGYAESSSLRLLNVVTGRKFETRSPNTAGRGGGRIGIGSLVVICDGAVILECNPVSMLLSITSS